MLITSSTGLIKLYYSLQTDLIVFTFTIGLRLTDDQLEEAAIVSGVLEIDDDFLEPEFRREGERIIPNSSETEPKNCAAAFMYLKSNFRM